MIDFLFFAGIVLVWLTFGYFAARMDYLHWNDKNSATPLVFFLMGPVGFTFVVFEGHALEGLFLDRLPVVKYLQNRKKSGRGITWERILRVDN